MKRKAHSKEQEMLFNRSWVDRPKGKPIKRKDYIPSHQRPGFDEKKVIKL